MQKWTVFIITMFFILLFVQAFVFGQDVDLITNTNDYWPASALDKPDYLNTEVDPTFRTKITRIVGNPGEPIPNSNNEPSLNGLVWPSEQLRHGYSKREPWNCDQSMIYLDRLSVGSSKKLWLDGETYEPLFARVKPATRVRWSQTEPHIMYYITNEFIGRWDVVEDTMHPAVTFSGYSDCTFGDGKGNFTNDGKKVAIYAKRKSDSHRVIFVANVESGTKENDIDASDANKINNCTISPLGNYIVAIGDYGLGSDRVRVYDASNGSILWTETKYGRPSHMDTQIDQNGDEVIVGIDKSNKGKIIKRKLSDGEVTTLADGYGSHASGRAIKRIGWTFVTYQNRTSTSYTYINEIVAVKLDGTRNERICHIHSNRFTYVAESHGAPSPDGLRVMFASDWDSGTYPVQSYVVDFRDKVITDVSKRETVPSDFSIVNYPNPFNPSTNIQFSIPQSGNVKIVIYDIIGREVSKIVEKHFEKGSYTFNWEAKDKYGNRLSSGMYIARIKAGRYMKSIKMLLMK